MDSSLMALVVASTAFVGFHFLLSHPLRAPLVKAVGERGFLGLYSLVALVTFVWMILAFRTSPTADLTGSGEIGWAVATVLTLPALVLFLGSLRGNPAMPDPTGKPTVPDRAKGVFTITRHPMMWGFALWALSHIVLWWSTRTLVVAFAILVLALLGALMQDRKKERLVGEAWKGWEAQTSFWPRWTNLPKAGRTLWLVAIALWLLATYAHIHGAGVPAGVWRWVL
ncbi:MAG: NnrU family protein [Croceibacterium sp.]